MDLIEVIKSVTCDRSVVSSTNKTDHHDITEIVLKVAINTIEQTNNLIEVTQISAVKIVVIFFSIDDLNKNVNCTTYSRTHP